MSGKQVKANCGNCGRNFMLESRGLKKRKLNDGRVQAYFTCPHCHKDFHVIYENDYTMKLKRQYDEKIHELLKIYNKKRDVPESLVGEIEGLRLAHKRALDELNGKGDRDAIHLS